MNNIESITMNNIIVPPIVDPAIIVPPIVDIVITRYNEHLDWIRYLPFEKINCIYIYNKGLNNKFFKNYRPYGTSKIIIKQLPNIGRIDHTLAYHILETWDSPADVLVSLPGSIMMNPKKGMYLSNIVRNLDNLKDKFGGFYSPRFRKVSPNFNYSNDNFQAKSIRNFNGNPFIKSYYPDFQAWKSALIDSTPMEFVAVRSMFAVCNENIKYHSKDTYIRLLESVSVGDNIENGHFAERIWAHLFKTMTSINKNFDFKKPV